MSANDMHEVSETELQDRVAKLVAGSLQKDWAKALNISPQYMSDMLNGRRAISEELAAYVGCRKTWVTP